jgi:peptidoglycan-N-acetylmuramic acid deacetylase
MPRGSSVRAVALLAVALAVQAAAAAACERPVYLSFDTGHMGVAPLVAEVLRRHDVKATFFLANERTRTGGSSLDDEWAPWWRARAEEGHAFGSHTWDHHSWQADVPGGLRLKPSQGAQAGKAQVLDAAGYCAELERPAQRFVQMTGQRMGSIFRAPGGQDLTRVAEGRGGLRLDPCGLGTRGLSGG